MNRTRAFASLASAVLLLSQAAHAQEPPRKSRGGPPPAGKKAAPGPVVRQPPPTPPAQPPAPAPAAAPAPATPKRRGRVVEAPPPPGAPGAPAAAPAAHEGELPGEKEFNECLRIPAVKRVKFTLKQESDLMDLVAWISGMTCKKFIVATSLRAQKVTIVSPTPVTPGEAYRAFLSALEVMGLTVAPAGRYLKVVQGNWAIQASIPTYTDKQQKNLPASDAVVTQIARVANTDVNELLLVLNKMKSRSGDVTSYKPTNTLIITDNALNVRRMLEIVKELDIPSEGEKIWVIRLKNADVEEVKKILDQLFSGKTSGVVPRMTGSVRGVVGPGGGEEDIANLSASKIVTDPASNSLIIVTSAPSFARIASLIKKLDVESEGVNQKINVYYLENGDAESMANTLASLTGGAAGGGRAGGRGAAAARVARPGGGPSIATLFEGDVKVSADKPTNSLVIVASPKDFMNLRGVIKKLDIPRRQVFVEATILEVTLNGSRALGFAYHGGGTVGSGKDQAIIFGGAEFSKDTYPITSFGLNPLTLMGLAVGARGQTIDGSGKLLGLPADIPSFGVMFQALQTNGATNVLSSPHILTTDNEPAEISVGQNLPFQGSVMGAGFGALPSTAGATGANLASFLPALSVQRQDVALKLKITPHVNESDMVRLELDQEVSDVSDPNYNGLGPSTSKRTAKTMVVVRDQQTVVIGGLMRNKLTESVSKIPLLGDIPILGYFFKNTLKTTDKTNLLIVLTPYVIRDQSDLRRIFKKKLEERREFLRRYSSFTNHELTEDIDFRHKRGLLSEISKVADQADADAKLMEESQRKRPEELEPVDMPQGMTPPTPSRTPATPTPGGTSEGGGIGATPPAGTQPPPPSTPPPPTIPPGTRQPPLR